jgi:hypothetical protein
LNKKIRKLIVIFFAFYTGASSSITISENKLKAAYIYRFISFVKWEGANEIISVSIQDEKEILTALADMSKAKNKYNILSYEEVTPKSVLYLSCNEKILPEQLEDYQQKSILVISSCDGDIDNGVMINFTQINGKLKFKINNTSAIKARLKISSQLLKLALVVK